MRIVKVFTEDGAGRLASSVVRSPKGRTLVGLEYVYDKNGNPLVRKTGRGQQLYAYDAVNRLTRVEFANHAGTHADTYTYDQVGNRTAKNGAPYTYDNNDQLTSAPGGLSFSYDPQGRRTSKTSPAGTETYAWDSLDQLKSSTSPSGELSTHKYDGQGRLTTTTQGSLTRSFNYALSDSPVKIASQLAGPAGLQSRTEQMLYGPAGLLEQQVNDSAPSFPVADSAGTLIGEVSSKGGFSSAPELDPWGVPVDAPEPSSSPAAASPIDQSNFGFLGAAGRLEMPGGGPVKLGARYYDPEVGAFLSVDPVTGDAAEPERRVPYTYGLSSPARFSDPDGRSAVDGAWNTTKNIVDAPAGAAQDWAANKLNDPGANPFAEIAAWPIGVLSSLATSENLGETLMAVLPIPLGKLRGLGKLGELLIDASKVREAVKAVGAAGKRAGKRLADETGSFGPDASRGASQGGRALSQAAKRRLAKQLGDIPRTASPVAQGGSSRVGRWWEYIDSKGNTKIVVEHADGSVHVGVPKPSSTHRAGGPPKYFDTGNHGHIGEG